MSNILKIVIISFFLCQNAMADIEGANKFTIDATENLFHIAKNNDSVEVARNKIVDYIRGNINIKWIAKFTLGKNWRKADLTQKERYTKLLEEYLILTYSPKFQGYGGETYKIKDTKEIAPNKYISHLSLYLKSGVTLDLEIFLLEKENFYKIVDVSGEGISFAATQRTEFSSLIASNGMDKFLDILGDKVKQLASN